MISFRPTPNPYVYVENNSLRYIDPFGLAPPGAIPPGVDIQRNIREARGMTPLQFYHAVQNGGKWDYKQIGRQYEDFGNYNYGVSGRAVGFDNLLNRAAGWAQGQAGTRDPRWGSPAGGPPYGDDPRDQRWIDEGKRDFNDDYYGSWDDGSMCRRYGPESWSSPPSTCHWDYSAYPPRAVCP